MSKVRFNLHNPKAEETRIRLVYRYDDQKLVYYTGLVVRPRWWNLETMRVRRTADNKHAPAMNAKLKELEDDVLKIHYQYQGERKALPPELFRAELDALHKGRTRPVAEDRTLFGFIARLIEERRASPDYTAGSVMVYVTTFKKLQEYAAVKRRLLDFEHITLDFHGDFTGWMNAAGFAPNYINKVVQTLKTFLGEAVDRGYTTNMAFRSRRFMVRKERVKFIHLNDAEVERLAALDLSAHARLDRVRDLFLVGCSTGLRFSDYAQARPDNIAVVQGQEVLTVLMQKVRREAHIPVLPMFRSLLDKYRGELPAVPTNQEMNRCLKEIGRLAGLTDTVPVTRHRGGVRLVTPKPKFELVATHTARRSFATNEYNRNPQNWRSIMAIMGQTKEETFFQYVGATGQELAAQYVSKREGKRAG